MKLKKTGDLWGISVKLLITITNEMTRNLSLILNNCIENVTFPDLMKNSKLVPLFENGNRLEPGNYRPISVLLTLSILKVGKTEIFEKFILNQMTEFVYSNIIMHSEQYGFTKGKLTTDASTTLPKQINDAWEKSQNVIGMFSDLSKAFACVDHQTFLCKLNHYSVRVAVFDLNASYRNQSPDGWCKQILIGWFSP